MTILLDNFKWFKLFMRLKEYRNKIKGEHFLNVIEAMMVLPILFSAVTFVVWYSSITHESKLMNEALQRAGKIASTIPNLDLSLISDATGDAQTIKEFKRAWKANELSKEAGINFLSSVGFLKNTEDKKLLTLTKNILLTVWFSALAETKLGNSSIA